MSDHCVQRQREATLEKEATGISIFLLEELGDARLRCAQLRKQIDEGIKLIEKSDHKDHFFEVAGHLIHAIPDTLMRMDKALSAAAMAAAKLDYEEIKDDLRPEKVEELEKALEEIRIRRVKRRSNKEARSTQVLVTNKAVEAFREVIQPLLQFETREALDQVVADTMIEFARMRAGNRSGLDTKLNRYKPSEDLDQTEWVDEVEEAMEEWFSSMKKVLSQKLASETTMKTTEASARLERLAAEAEMHGRVDLDSLRTLIANLEGGPKRASTGAQIAAVFRDLAAGLLSADAPPSRVHLASVLRRVLGDTLPVTVTAETTQTADQIYQQANSREDVIKGFSKANPSMSKDDLEKAADEWEKNKDVVKDKQAALDPAPSLGTEDVILVALENMLEDVRKAKMAAASGNAKKMFFSLLGVLNELGAIGRAYDLDDMGFLMRVFKVFTQMSGARPSTNFSASAQDPQYIYARGQDPFWMKAKRPGKAQDGTPFNRGDRIFYFPNTRTILVGEKAEAAARKFDGEISDEAVYNYGR